MTIGDLCEQTKGIESPSNCKHIDVLCDQTKGIESPSICEQVDSLCERTDGLVDLQSADKVLVSASEGN